MSRKSHKVLRGIPASPGLGHGTVFIHDSRGPAVERYSIPVADVSKEIARFDKAVDRTRNQLHRTHQMVEDKIDKAHADIFEAQEVLLDDPLLTEAVREGIRSKRLNAEHVLEEVTEDIVRIFREIDVPHFSVQNLDVLDVASRVRDNLIERAPEALENLARDVVIVAHDLHPSDTARLSHQHVLGIVTEVGGPTSHSAILAKALKIPAVVGIEGLLEHVQQGDSAIVDGTIGSVTVRPTASDLGRYEQDRAQRREVEATLLEIRELPCETTDGYQVELAGNLEFPNEVDSVRESGAKGIGLFRSEFFYINRGYIPSEDEQFQVYKEVAEKMAPHGVICRTLDMGGDKFMSATGIKTSDINPFLGLRAIRLCLANPAVFQSQLRAVLRASAYGHVQIMFPFITDISEVRQAKQLLADAQRELKRKNIPYDENIQVGIMIETPSAALTARALAQEVDFFSLGTNDLIQYTMAVDRVNESVAHLYNPLHPSVLHLIQMTIDEAHRAGIWAGVCGEMAGDPALAALLVGMGVDELSMSSVAVAEVKQFIRAISLEEINHMRDDIFSRLQDDGPVRTLERFRRKVTKRLEAQEKNARAKRAESTAGS